MVIGDLWARLISKCHILKYFAKPDCNILLATYNISIKLAMELSVHHVNMWIHTNTGFRERWLGVLQFEHSICCGIMNKGRRHKDNTRFINKFQFFPSIWNAIFLPSITAIFGALSCSFCDTCTTFTGIASPGYIHLHNPLSSVSLSYMSTISIRYCMHM